MRHNSHFQLLNESELQGTDTVVIQRDDVIFRKPHRTTVNTLVSVGLGLASQRDFSTLAEAEASAPQIPAPYIRLYGYTTPGDGGGALYRQVVSEPSHAGKFQTAAGVWYEIAESILTERMFGAPCDSAFDVDTEAGTDAILQIQNWLDCPVSIHKRFTGISRISNSVVARSGDLIEGDGFQTGLTGKQILALSSNAVLNCHGAAPVQIAELGANANRGDQTLTLTSTAGLKQGDWVLIENPTNGSYNPARDEYHAGEWCRIMHVVSSTVINIAEPLYDSYVIADVDLYMMNNPPTIMRNFRIEAPPLEDRAGLDITRQCFPRIENLMVYGTEHSNIWLSRSVEVYVNNNAGLQPFSDTLGTEYDVALSNIHGGQIFGSYTAQRHGIAIGGDAGFVGLVPNTRIMVYASTQNNQATGSLDMGGHGNTRYCQAIGGTHNSIVIGGENNKYSSLIIRSELFRFIYGSEFHSGDFVFDNCLFETSGGTTAYIHLPQTINQQGSCRYHFNNCVFSIDNAYTRVIHLEIMGSTFNPSVFVNGGRVNNSAGLTSFLDISRSSGTGTVDNAVISNLNGLSAAALLTPVSNAGVGITITNTGNFSDQLISNRLRVGPGTDATGSGSNVFGYFSNSGATNLALRNSSTDVEAYFGVAASTSYIGSLTNHSFAIFTNDVNRIVVDTVKIAASLPVRVPSFTVAGVPSAATAGAGAMIYVSNESGGAVIAFSDGAAWRRVTDRAVIS